MAGCTRVHSLGHESQNPNQTRDTQPKKMSTGPAGHLLLNAFGALEGSRAKPPAAGCAPARRRQARAAARNPMNSPAGPTPVT
eukprot:1500217-Heterocapsa_arctica.AAC.1